MLASETVQVGLLTSQSMVYELTPQREPGRHWWSPKIVSFTNGGRDEAHIRIDDDDDDLGAIRGLVWAVVVELDLAIADFLFWQLWVFVKS
jgi:hypothetical protein